MAKKKKSAKAANKNIPKKPSAKAIKTSLAAQSPNGQEPDESKLKWLERHGRLQEAE